MESLYQTNPKMIADYCVGRAKQSQGTWPLLSWSQLASSGGEFGAEPDTLWE